MWLPSCLLLLGVPAVFAKCKCTPGDDCWPSSSKWNTLNSTVNGKLIANQPIAVSCYTGPALDPKQCQTVSKQWANTSFQELSPIGYTYPVLNTCVPTNPKNISEAVFPGCDLGPAPVYTVNATNADDVAAGIKFAKDHNVRLVIKNTGHDIVGRSQGYGSLSIWIKYIQDGLRFQQKYTPSNGTCQSNWTGSAIVIGGGYIWKDVYEFAAKHGHIAVGGDDKTVGAIGGYLQGAGHGPASHAFGLATDQVLEYKVVLASGKTVTASACQNTDLFTALRGGGGGTYGVVVSATIKVHPTRRILAHTLQVSLLGKNASVLLNSTAGLLSQYPRLSDTGFAGNGMLVRKQKTWVYQHSFMKMIESNASSSTIDHIKRIMNEEAVDHFRSQNETELIVKSNFALYDSFQEYFLTGTHQSDASSNVVMASRFFDKESLIHQQRNISSMLHTLFSQTGAGAYVPLSSLTLCLIGGGQVLHSAPHTSVHPAWRKTYLLAEHVDSWYPGVGLQGAQQVKNESTSKKLRAMQSLAPRMGTYLNEADPWDPDWKKEWFGDQYDWLESVKDKYDPDGVFWCWRCVGNEKWEEVTGGTIYGPLCERD